MGQEARQLATKSSISSGKSQDRLTITAAIGKAVTGREDTCSSPCFCHETARVEWWVGEELGTKQISWNLVLMSSSMECTVDFFP